MVDQQWVQSSQYGCHNCLKISVENVVCLFSCFACLVFAHVALFSASAVAQWKVQSSQSGCQNYLEIGVENVICLFSCFACLVFAHVALFSALCGWPAVGSKGFHAVVQRKGAASFKLMLKSIEQSSSR